MNIDNEKIKKVLKAIPLAVTFGIGWIAKGIKDRKAEKVRIKNESKRQEIIRKIQSEIEVLKNDKKREEYRKQLQAKLKQIEFGGKDGKK